MIHVGTCGFRKAHDTTFKHLRVLEVNKTFYKPPMDRTARRWRDEEAPADFIFTLKAWQLITHEPSSPTYRKADLDIPDESRDRYGSFRPTEEVFDAWERTRQIAGLLGAPIVVFQCPASFQPTAEHKQHMRAFFRQVDRADLRFAWEPRGDWREEEIEALCADLDLLHCVDPFDAGTVTEEIAYFRLHGVDGYDHNYTASELQMLRDRCAAFEEAYVLFNNISMWEDALRFREILGQV